MGYCKSESKLALRSTEIQPVHCSICSFLTERDPPPPFFLPRGEWPHGGVVCVRGVRAAARVALGGVCGGGGGRLAL